MLFLDLLWAAQAVHHKASSSFLGKKSQLIPSVQVGGENRRRNEPRLGGCDLFVNCSFVISLNGSFPRILRFANFVRASILIFQRLPFQASSYWRLRGWKVLFIASFCRRYLHRIIHFHDRSRFQNPNHRA